MLASKKCASRNGLIRRATPAEGLLRCSCAMPDIQRIKEIVLAESSRLLLLKVMSLFSGGFLIFAGILGCTAPVLGGGLVYFIGSIYAILFGAIVMTIEVKDKTKFVSAFYHWLDTYLKFLTFQV